MKTGRRNLITDVTGLRVGNAEDLVVKTGVSVLTADAPFIAGVAVMGGAPGTRETDLLAPDKVVQAVDALVLAGGSAFGLDAAGGVMAALAAAGRGHPAGGVRVPIVPSAILFDLVNGGDKNWGEDAPYGRLGRAAYAAAGETFAIGTAGAGTGASTATVRGGLGSASLVLPGGATVGALVAVNALGSPIVPGGRRFWAAPFEIGDEFGGLGVAPAPPLATTFETKLTRLAGARNTTIAIVATDAALDQAQVTRMSWAAQDGIGRALVPAHTPADGDLVFGAATGARPLSGSPLEVLDIGHGAALCLTRAIARAVYEATALPGDLFPAWRDLPE
ncbi:MAG: P1 family peptidase [Pseudomonadota bacterium]